MEEPDMKEKTVQDKKIYYCSKNGLCNIYKDYPVKRLNKPLRSQMFAPIWEQSHHETNTVEWCRQNVNMLIIYNNNALINNRKQLGMISDAGETINCVSNLAMNNSLSSTSGETKNKEYFTKEGSASNEIISCRICKYARVYIILPKLSEEVISELLSKMNTAEYNMAHFLTEFVKHVESFLFVRYNSETENTNCRDSTAENRVYKLHESLLSCILNICGKMIWVKHFNVDNHQKQYCTSSDEQHTQDFANNDNKIVINTPMVDMQTSENGSALLKRVMHDGRTNIWKYLLKKHKRCHHLDKDVRVDFLKNHKELLDTPENMVSEYKDMCAMKSDQLSSCLPFKVDDIPTTIGFDKNSSFVKYNKEMTPLSSGLPSLKYIIPTLFSLDKAKPTEEQGPKPMSNIFSISANVIPRQVFHVSPFCSLQSYFETLDFGNIQVKEKMSYEGNRLQSFLSFPSSASAIRLSQAGFYYSGRGDETICFSCGLHYEHWTRSDQPLAVHRRLNPFCPFITGINSDNKPIHTDDSMQIQVLRDRERSQIPNETMQLQVLTDDSGVDMESDCESATGGTKQTASNSSNDVMGPTGANIQSPKYQSDNTSLSNSVLSDFMASGTVRDIVPKRLSYEHAVYPQYCDIKVREDSFTNWTSTLRQTPAILSKHGFYYAGYADCVRCFYCGIGLKSWEPQDDPLEEHIRNRPSCEFIVFTKGSDFVSEVLQKISQKDQAANSASAPSTHNSNGNSGDLFNSDTVLKAKEMGYNDNIITMAVKALAVNQDQNSPDLETLLEKIFVIEEQQNQATSSHNEDERLTIDAPSGAETSDSNASTASPNGQISEDSTKTNTLDGSLCDTITEYVGETNEEHSDAVMSMGAGHSRLQAAKSDANNSIESSYYSLPARLQSGSSDTSAMTPSMNDKNSDEEERDRIMEENRQLRDEMMCKICLENPINIVFLPCGHYCTCAMCAPALASCPICRSVIRGSVRASTASRKRSGRHS